jgi:hypothetical protein
MGKSKVFLKDTQVTCCSTNGLHTTLCSRPTSRLTPRPHQYDRLEQAKGKALRGRVIVIQSWYAFLPTLGCSRK